MQIAAEAHQDSALNICANLDAHQISSYSVIAGEVRKEGKEQRNVS